MSSRRSSTAIDNGRRYSTRSSSSSIKEKDEDFYPPSCPQPKRYPPNSSRSSRASQSSRSSGSGGGPSRRSSTATAGSSRSGTRSGSSTTSGGNSRRGSVIQKYLPPDPRPSKADPDERLRRKQHEKEHGGFDWTDGVELALAGAVTLFGIEKALSKGKK